MRRLLRLLLTEQIQRLSMLPTSAQLFMKGIISMLGMRFWQYATANAIAKLNLAEMQRFPIKVYRRRSLIL